jgi:site-specific recombinase XerD
MNEVAIQELIESAIAKLVELQLCDGSIDSYRHLAFQPVLDFYHKKSEAFYRTELMDELSLHYQELLHGGSISRNTLRWRLRGLGILNEFNKTGSFEWKVFTAKKKSPLSHYYEEILTRFLSSLGDICRIGIYRSIAERYFLFLTTNGHHIIKGVSPVDIRYFIVEMFVYRPKSMDDVVTVLRKLHTYFRQEELLDIRFEPVLCVPRARDKKVLPCFSSEELNLILKQVNTETPAGKRDYAIIQLGISTGLRAGDITNLKLTDVDWKTNEIHLIQGKTKQPLLLPLEERSGNAIIDYILNGRPKSESSYMFLRSLAPYHKFQDGVSVACIFRKYLKSAGISHTAGDGKTFHGLRRTLGTEMVVQGIPVTTVSQVLGHHSPETAKQYISLDTNGLKQCALSFGTIGEVRV